MIINRAILLPTAILAALTLPIAAQNDPGYQQQQPAAPDAPRLSPQELSNLVAPVALYPDMLLSQVLAASTYPLEITEADWDFIHSVNLKATFFCCQQAAKHMLKGDGGKIVNISSLGAIKAWAHHAHYCASKAGVVMLTRALRS